jgi:hypothetical protein
MSRLLSVHDNPAAIPARPSLAALEDSMRWQFPQYCTMMVVVLPGLYVILTSLHSGEGMDDHVTTTSEPNGVPGVLRYYPGDLQSPGPGSWLSRRGEPLADISVLRSPVQFPSLPRMRAVTCPTPASLSGVRLSRVRNTDEASC